MRSVRLIILISACAPISAGAHAVPSTVAETQYRINAGDDLDIFVWGEDRLQRTVRVLPDGTFGFPLVGRVEAAGALPAEVEARITEGLKPQFRNVVPQVTVSVKNATGMQFSVIGKVQKPGVFTPGRYVNALEALSMAGGPTEFAQLGNVVIIRKTPAGLQSIRVKFNEAMRGAAGDISSGTIPEIQAGDTIVVP